jgi:hypothetical protein
MASGLRNVTKGRAVIYFEIDDRERMIARLLGR